MVKETKKTKKSKSTTEKPEEYDSSKGVTIRQRVINFFKKKRYGYNLFLINMERWNGNVERVLIKLDGDEFTYLDGVYVIDDEFKYYDSSSGFWCLDYHEGVSIPIKRKIDYNGLVKGMQVANVDVDMALNPKTLEIYSKSSFIQKAMKGQELDETLKKLMIIAGIAAAASVIMLITFVFKSGMLQDINIGL